MCPAAAAPCDGHGVHANPIASLCGWYVGSITETVLLDWMTLLNNCITMQSHVRNSAPQG